jgi:hypothetical protein
MDPGGRRGLIPGRGSNRRVAEEVIRNLNPTGAMSLRGYYGEGVPRAESYEAMVQHILSCVRGAVKERGTK